MFTFDSVEPEGLMVMAKCDGDQNTWQIAQRSPLAWAALSGCGYRNTWVECLKDSNAQLRKDLSKQLINFAVRLCPSLKATIF